MGEQAGHTAAPGGKRSTLAGYPTVTRKDLLEMDKRLQDAKSSLEEIARKAGENAGAFLRTTLVEKLTDRPLTESVITVLAGTGRKGLAALAAAQDLAKNGVTVIVVLARKKKDYKPAWTELIDQLEKEAKKVYGGYNERAFEQADLILDGLLGAGLEGNPRASISLLVKGANFSMKPIVALDLPTGLDPTTGIRTHVAIKADATLCVGLPKQGMLGETNRALCGTLYLLDAGVDYRHWSAVIATPVATPFKGKPALLLE